MRIIAGRYKGLNFNSPKGAKTHPMSDKVRGGLFNSLGDIEGLDVLDTYSGSGALSFEAVSRGAKQATAIEADNTAHKIIQENISSLKLNSKVKATRAYLNSWLNKVDFKTFDIILVDPPYHEAEQNLDTIDRLDNFLKPDGTLVLSWPGNKAAPKVDGLEIAKTKSYGDAQLVFYKKLR